MVHKSVIDPVDEFTDKEGVEWVWVWKSALCAVHLLRLARQHRIKLKSFWTRARGNALRERKYIRKTTLLKISAPKCRPGRLTAEEVIAKWGEKLGVTHEWLRHYSSRIHVVLGRKLDFLKPTNPTTGFRKQFLDADFKLIA